MDSSSVPDAVANAYLGAAAVDVRLLNPDWRISATLNTIPNREIDSTLVKELEDAFCEHIHRTETRDRDPLENAGNYTHVRVHCFIIPQHRCGGAE